MKNRNSNVSAVSEMPISAMIDVVFLLLVYFIVTQAPILENTLLTVNLPTEKKNQTPIKNPNILHIEVSKMSNNEQEDLNLFLLNNEKMNLERLSERLNKIASLSPDAAVLITCSNDAIHQKLIRILDICNFAGLKSVNLCSK